MTSAHTAVCGGLERGEGGLGREGPEEAPKGPVRAPEQQVGEGNSGKTGCLGAPDREHQTGQGTDTADMGQAKKGISLEFFSATETGTQSGVRENHVPT